MDDRLSEYVIAIGVVCAAAELASFEVEVVTSDGQVVVGPVGRPTSADGKVEFDDTGLQRTVRIDDAIVKLDEVVQCTMRQPASAESPG